MPTSEDGNQQAPGQVISPHPQQDGEPEPAVNNAAPTPEPTEPPKESPADNANSPATWKFTPENDAAVRSLEAFQHPAASAISWTASEFIAHDKAASWYALLGMAGGLVAALVYLLTRDLISTGMMVVVTIVFGIFAARKPRVLNYSVNENGIQVGNKTYLYGDFKSFSVMDEGGLNAILLMPLKRFMPTLTIYYAPPDEEKIVTVLAQYLPIEDRDYDMVDRLMRKVRF